MTFQFRFQFRGETFTLESDPHGGERELEIPLARWAIARLGPSFKEVGAVMPYWGLFPVKHIVIDPYDPVANVNLDVEKFDLAGCNILSISTLEHLGRKEYGNDTEDPEKPLRVLTRIWQDAARYFVTVPLGYNPPLDQYIRDLIGDDATIFKKTGHREWIESPGDWSLKYGSPLPYANGVVILTNL